MLKLDISLLPVSGKEIELFGQSKFYLQPLLKGTLCSQLTSESAPRGGFSVLLKGIRATCSVSVAVVEPVS